MSPASRMHLSFTMGVVKRFWETTAKTAPLSAAAAIIASHSCRLTAMGFSTRTWTPARSSVIVAAACSKGGRHTEAASQPPAASISSQLLKTAAFSPCLAALARAFSGYRSTRAATAHGAPQRAYA